MGDDGVEALARAVRRGDPSPNPNPNPNPYPNPNPNPNLQSLLAALAPSLLWPAPRQPVPKLERPQAVAATRHLLHYYAQAR